MRRDPVRDGRLTLRRAIFVAVLSLACGAIAHAQQAPMSIEARIPGISARRVAEPVFGGHAYIYEVGRENARSIVLVHGLGDAGAYDWASQIPWMTKSFHVIAPDLPGFARSDKGNELYSPANYAKFLKFVTERFVDRPFTLVGHSMGAVVSLRYAARHGSDVERLVVMDAPGILYRFAFGAEYLENLKDGSPPGLDLVTRWFGGALHGIMRRVERSDPNLEEILAEPKSRESLLGGNPKAIAAMALAVDDASAYLPLVRTPTLVVWGGQDRVAPLRTGKVLAHVLPRARLAVLDEAGHSPMAETPERLRGLLEEFFADGVSNHVTTAKSLPPRGDGKCQRQRAVLYEGEYGKLTLRGCRDVVIRNARVRELRVEHSTVSIENSEIGGGAVGIYARSATIEMTNGRVRGQIAIRTLGSRLDLAGVEVIASESLVHAVTGSEIVFSLSRVNSPSRTGTAHEYHALQAGARL